MKQILVRWLSPPTDGHLRDWRHAFFLKVDLGAAARKAAAPYSLDHGARSRRFNPTVWVRPVPTSSLPPVPIETANVPCIELGDDLAEFDTIFPDCVQPSERLDMSFPTPHEHRSLRRDTRAAHCHACGFWD